MYVAVLILQCVYVCMCVCVLMNMHVGKFCDARHMHNFVPRPIPSFSMLHTAHPYIKKLEMGLGTRLRHTGS